MSALQEHVDPGPGLREKVDRQAGYMTRIVRLGWWPEMPPPRRWERWISGWRWV